MEEVEVEKEVNVTLTGEEATYVVNGMYFMRMRLIDERKDAFYQSVETKDVINKEIDKISKILLSVSKKAGVKVTI